MSTTRAEMGKYGPKHDYRGAHAVLDYAGRHLLGEIVDVYRDPVTSMVRARLRHFNGEAWPIEPRLMALAILERP